MRPSEGSAALPASGPGDDVVAAIAAALALVERDFGAGARQRHDAETAAAAAVGMALAEAEAALVPRPPRVSLGLKDRSKETVQTAGADPWFLVGLQRQMASRQAPGIMGRQI